MRNFSKILLEILVTVISVILSFGLIAQNYSSRNFTVVDGLPSNETYCIIQDLDGYIWIATDKGISKFDGHNFKNFGTNDGLKSTVIYKLLSSPKGGIVFYGADNRIGSIYRDSIQYSFNENHENIATIHSLREGIVVFPRRMQKMILYNWRGEKVKEYEFEQGWLKSSLKFIPHQFSENNFDSLITKIENINQCYPRDLLPADTINHLFYNKKSDGAYFFNGNELVLSTCPIPPTIIDNGTTGSIYLEQNENLWIGMKLNKGIHIFSIDSLKKRQTLLDGSSVSSIIRDQYQQYWISTTNNGVYVLKNTDYEQVIKQSVNTMSIKDSLLTAVINDSTITNYKLKRKKREDFKFPFKIRSFIMNKGQVITSFLADTALIKQLKSPKNIEISYYGSSNMAILQEEVFSIQNDFIWFKSNPRDTFLVKGLGHDYTYFNQVFNGKIYNGRATGLFEVQIKDGTFSAKKMLDLPSTSIAFGNKFHTVGTKGYGFVITDTNFKILSHIKSDEGLLGNFVSSLLYIGDTLFVGTNKGITIRYPSKNSTKGYQYLTSNKADGLWDNNVIQLALYEGYLYVATLKGIQRIKVEKLFKTHQSPRIRFSKVNEQNILDEDTITIPPGKKEISVEINNIHFEERPSETDYRLLGFDSTWKNTKSNQLKFINISPGQFTLQLRSKLVNNEVYNYSKITLIVEPLFIQTTLFKVFIGIFILSLFALLFFIREWYVRKRNKRLIDQEKLRYKALATQLSPHFMYNAMGGVQSLILQEKNDVAIEYLASFSNVLHQSLLNVQSLYIPFLEEKKLIDAYVKVEQSRFSQTFDLNWNIEQQIDLQKIHIPSMFLQPIVENSIVHGITNREGGHIIIHVKCLSKLILEIIIEDNGKGLGISSKVQVNRKRGSLAIENIKGRIDMFQKIYKKSFMFKMEEIKDVNKEVKGTRVIINIPYNQDIE